MSKAKLWIFGDSFDSPITLEAFDYAKNYYEGGLKHYSDLLALKLNLDIQHFGTPGAGPPTILHYLADNINNIDTGDYVVVGISEPVRLLSFYPQDEGTNLSSAAVGNNVEAARDYKVYSEYYFESLKKYVVDCIDPFRGEILHYYFNIFSNILLNSKASKTFLYGSDFWCKYESIYEHTEGKLKDNHWSFNGQLEFGKHILKRWKLKDHFHYKPEHSKEFNIPHYRNFLPIVPKTNI